MPTWTAGNVPASTLRWLTEPDNPAVAVLARTRLLGEPWSQELEALWSQRNGYEPIARVLEAQHPDGSWDAPARDYQKYGGSLWQIHFLGELWADRSDERVQLAAEYAFFRQLDDGSWSASNRRPSGSITCLTANVGRALARMGWAEDPRVLAALEYCVRVFEELGAPNCRPLAWHQLNGYCHMLLPKLLLFLAEVPEPLWPSGAYGLRDDCVARLRDKRIVYCLPAEAADFHASATSGRAADRAERRTAFLAEHGPLHYQEKPGWLKLGYPLSYNSDALEALAALAAAGVPSQADDAAAIALVEQAADAASRWVLRNSFNGKWLANVERKGRPSKWLTLRALLVLLWARG